MLMMMLKLLRLLLLLLLRLLMLLLLNLMLLLLNLMLLLLMLLLLMLVLLLWLRVMLLWLTVQPGDTAPRECPSVDSDYRTCGTVNGVLGDHSGAIPARHCPHRVQPCTWRPAQRWRAVRRPAPPKGPSDAQLTATCGNSVAHGAPPGRRPGRHRPWLAPAAGYGGGGGFPTRVS